ncbi:hypothetical protein LJC73_06720, partial [Bacteroidales bacterium OttesenSCG-928-L14]|nr:hypothetical protein [Bacteroidales bacterium OttesenSCG-928-L14]
SFETPKGDIFYSQKDISNFITPEKVNIKCGSFNRTFELINNTYKYSFARPINPTIAECTFIFGNNALDKFNDKISIIHTCTALDIISDTLINMLNGFNIEEKYIGTDLGIFLTFIDSQINYIKKSSDSLATISTPADVAFLNNKIRVVEGRRNSVALSYSETHTNKIAITDLYALDLASKFCDYYEKWLHLSNSSKHLYSGEIVLMSCFKRTKPDLESFLNTISEQAKNTFLNYMYQRLLNDAKKAYKDNNVNTSLILIDNYEYISKLASNHYANDFHKLKIECLETLRDSYLKLSELFGQNENYITSRNYYNQANIIQNDLMVLKNKSQDYSNYFTENNESTNETSNNNTIISTQEIISESNTDNTINDTNSDELIEKEEIPTIIEDNEIETITEVAISSNCSDYNKKLKVLIDKIDDFTIFTIENLYNRYSNEYPDCAELSLEEWIKSLGREDLLPKKRRK